MDFTTNRLAHLSTFHWISQRDGRPDHHKSNKNLDTRYDISKVDQNAFKVLKQRLTITSFILRKSERTVYVTRSWTKLEWISTWWPPLYIQQDPPPVCYHYIICRASRSSRWFCVFFFCSTALRSGSFRWPSKRPWQKDWKTKCWVGSTILPCNPCFRLKNPNYLKYPTKRFDRDFNAKTFTFLGHTCITHFLFCTKLDTTTRIIWVDLLSFIEFYGIKTRPVVWTPPIRGW
jgi:hypothetical protein